MKILGINFAPLNIPLSRRAQTLAAAAWISLVFGGFVGVLAMAYILIFTRIWWIGVLYLIWMYFDMDISEHGGRRSFWVRNWSWWYYFKDYFPVKLIRREECKMNPEKNYLFCYFPHGLVCTGAYASFSTEACGFQDQFPGFSPYMITLDTHFSKPFFRDFALAMGGVSASAKSINYILGHPDKGKVAVLAVGGAAESFYCQPGRYKIILNKRRGFIKLALKNGTPLVPVFGFGETDLFSQVERPEGSFFRNCQDFLRKIIGLAPIVFFGRGFFQYNFGLIPRRLPVTVVVGAPIEVPKVENPTDEQISEYHDKFREAIKKLFDEDKHKYLRDPEKTELEIV